MATFAPTTHNTFFCFMAIHNDLGKWGEQLAVDLLVTKGYAIVQRNWHAGNMEIDIVAMKNDRIVFVEVKTRSSDFVDPADAVDRRRIMRMVRAANSYVNAYNIPHQVQFDIILIVGTPDAPTPPNIEHIPDAFLPPLRTIR